MLVLLPAFLMIPFGAIDLGLTFCCGPNNDLFRTMKQGIRFDTVQQAIDSAKEGSGVLLLDGQEETPAQIRQASLKRLHVYLELPAHGSEGSQRAKQIEWERVYVTTDLFGPDLKRDRILSIGRQNIAVAKSDDCLLSVGRVAGFDKLAFGLPSQSYPLLWMRDPTTMVASASISHFSSARYAPSKAWKPVIQTILRWLRSPASADRFMWKPEIEPCFDRTQTLPSKVESQATRRAATWFSKSHLILAEPDVALYMKADQWPDRVGPRPIGNGDGRSGIIEGYSSAIDGLGNQPVRYYRRADCNAESAMALALAGDAHQRQVGKNIAEFIAAKSQIIHNDAIKASYGLAGWNDLPNNRGTFYGDDNARYILGLIGASGALHETRWDDQILKCILANFRTSGTNGFRGDNLWERDIERLGWRHFYDSPTVNMAPHFEAYLCACYLWAYQKTGFKPLLDRTNQAIERVMLAGEDAWTWTNGSQQERARMLLPLSWLRRVDDSPTHRRWLDEMVRKVLQYQDRSGAIREEFGDLSHGIAGPPRSNEAFGTGETPLIQENGDPLADMLYTTNFAFLGLHEAAAVTKNPDYLRAENRLADFLCRIQIKSSRHPELDGAWFRAFDFGDWDYWASNADLGWGAWSIETGWSVAWITSVLALRQRRQAFWDVHPSFKVNKSLVSTMFAGVETKP